MAKGVFTTYIINGNKYSSYILGDNIRQIKHLLDLRGINEKIESKIQSINTIEDYSILSDSLFLENLPAITHLACYLSFIALKSKMISIEDIVGDEGIVHQLVHLMTDSIQRDTVTLKRIKTDLRNLQKLAPGLYYSDPNA
jgi:hypothetical protein